MKYIIYSKENHKPLSIHGRTMMFDYLDLAVRFCSEFKKCYVIGRNFNLDLNSYQQYLLGLKK